MACVYRRSGGVIPTATWYNGANWITFLCRYSNNIERPPIPGSPGRWQPGPAGQSGTFRCTYLDNVERLPNISWYGRWPEQAGQFGTLSVAPTWATLKDFQPLACTVDGLSKRGNLEHFLFLYGRRGPELLRHVETQIVYKKFVLTFSS